MRQKDKINLLNSKIGRRATHSVLRRGWVQTVLLSVMCLVAFAVVTGVAYSVHKQDRDGLNQVFLQSAKDLFLKLENTLLHERDAVEALVIVFENLKVVEEARFKNLAGELLAHSQFHQSIFWVSGSTAIFGVEAPSYEGLVGFDLGRHPSLKAALKEAGDKGTLTTVSAALPFSHDQKNKDFFIIGPVYEPQAGLKNSPKKLRGFVVKVLQVSVIIDALIVQSSMPSEQIELNIRILDEAKAGAEKQVYSNVADNDQKLLNTPQFRQAFASFLKQWVVVVAPVSIKNRDRPSLTVVTIFLFGISGVFGYAWVVFNMMRKRERIETEVTKRTVELQENHYQLLSMIESAPQGIVVHHKGKFLYANPTLVEMFGYKSLHKVLALKSLSHILSADDYEAIMKYWENQYNGQDVDESFELNGVRKNGSVFSIINRSFVIKWNGRPAICSTFVNVSERRKVVDALIESEQRFKDFADAASDWYWEMGPDLKYTYFSERLLDVTGLLPEDIVGKERYSLCATETEIQDWEEHQKTLVAHEPFQNFEYAMKVPKVKTLYVRVSGVPLFGAEGKFLGYRGVGTDNTQHKLDQIKLENAQTELKNAYDILEDKVVERTKELEFQKKALDEHGIVSIADVHGDITYINEKFCDISGYSADELLGQNHRILISGEHSPKFFKDMWVTISNGNVWQGEIKNKNKEGGFYWVQTTIVPTLNDDGKPFQYVAIRTEITTMKEHETTLLEQQEMLISQTVQLEEALRSEKEYNTLQQQFISMASHEFRTPISIIDMTAQRLLKRHDDMTSEQRVDRFKKIRKAIERITGLIERTLDAAKIDEGHLKYSPQACNIRQIILDCILVQVDISEGYLINTDLADLPDLIFADPDHVQQIFTNLLSNAIKYSPDHNEIKVRGWVEHDMVLVSVTDHGIGIPEQEMPKMFNRFFRTSNSAGIPGTGIGLSLVKQMIEMQGGNIRVESRDGEGAVFCVSFKIKNLDLS
ncbi:MAG: hypothetical protein COB59_07645 [Rhodospirillaceae bacterium]|nr:MAG: hypothetical protein COB59_07645 [Rhodospirillaceae bacterium]